MAHTYTHKSWVQPALSTGNPFVVPANSTVIVSSLMLGGSSTSQTSGAVTVTLQKSGASAVVLVFQHPVPASSVLEVMVARGNLVLEAGDTITFTAVADSTVSIVMSYVLDTVTG